MSNQQLNKGNIDSGLNEISIEELLNEIDEIEKGLSEKKPDNDDNAKFLCDSDKKIVDEFERHYDENVSDEEDNVVEKECSKKKSKSIKNDIVSTLLSWAKIFIIAVVVTFILNVFVITNAVIPTGSMESTVMTGDKVIGFNLSYLFTDPERGDVIIFKYPDNESVLFIKRIIGVPGDTVEIRDGLVYINGSEEPLDEPYLSVTPKGNFGPYLVPEDSYFVLGDNRNVSNDSRLWENTFVHRDKIVAKALFIYYPSFSLIK